MIRRSAISLTEVLVVLSIGSTVLTLAVGTIHRAIEVSDSAQNDGQQLLSVNRFLEQFRNDVHLGIAIDLKTDQWLAIELSDHSVIEYGVEANRITRKVKTSEDELARETIYLATNSEGTFDFDQASRTASLRIHMNSKLSESPPRRIRSVEAILARLRSSYPIEEAKP